MPRSADLGALLVRPVVEVAPVLLGATLRHADVAVRLTEVEAYDGSNDPGSHAFRGPTPRNSVMFGPAGHLYVYFTYGMHYCCNVVCGPEGTASAVLLRAGEVVEGADVARSRRPSARTDRELARGPARLCQALAIGREQNGHDLTAPPLTLEVSPPVDAPVGVPTAAEAAVVHTGPRVGLRAAADRPWRFWLADEPTVSPYRPAAVRSRRTT